MPALDRYPPARPRAMALVAALIAILVLTLLLVAGFFAGQSGHKVAGNFKALAGVQNLAEAGLSRGKLVLANHLAANPDFSGLLSAGNPLIPDTTFSDGYYRVSIRNNDAYPVNPDPGGALTDTDRTVLLEVEAKSDRGARAKIEALVGRPGALVFPAAGAGSGALAVCGANPETSIDGGLVSGYDWAWPGAFACGGACSGTKIDPPTGLDPGGHGVVYSDPAGWGMRYNQSASSTVENPAGFFAVQFDSSLPCADWANLARQLASLDADVKNVLVKTEAVVGSDSWGTRSDPRLTLLDPQGGAAAVSGAVDGAGILVVTAPLAVPAGASFHYEGVILLLGGQAALSLDGANQNIFGAVLIVDSPPDAQLELSLTNGAALKHSRQAIQNATSALTGGSGGGMVTYAWRNIE